MTSVKFNTKDPLQLLGELISEISELGFCAAWMGGVEYLIPELCRRALESGQPQLWGQSFLDPVTAGCLWRIAEELDHWADLDEAGLHYEAFSPFPIPEEYLQFLDDGPSNEGLGPDLGLTPFPKRFLARIAKHEAAPRFIAAILEPDPKSTT